MYPQCRVRVELRSAAIYPAFSLQDLLGCKTMGTTVLLHLLAQPPWEVLPWPEIPFVPNQVHLANAPVLYTTAAGDRDLQTPWWYRCFTPPLNICWFDEFWNYCMLLISKTCCNYIMTVVKEIKWHPRSHQLIIWYLINATIYLLTSLSNYADF